MALNPEVWGKWYWGFLHTIAVSYPKHPNSTTKRKYYDFIQSLPLFIPVETISTDFSKLLSIYPVAPYLDNNASFVKWVHFIHNKINEKLERETITMDEFYVNYYNHYKSKKDIHYEFKKIREKIFFVSLIVTIVGLIYYLYHKS
jgi:hypothetical protein